MTNTDTPNTDIDNSTDLGWIDADQMESLLYDYQDVIHSQLGCATITKSQSPPGDYVRDVYVNGDRWEMRDIAQTAECEGMIATTNRTRGVDITPYTIIQWDTIPTPRDILLVDQTAVDEQLINDSNPKRVVGNILSHLYPSSYSDVVNEADPMSDLWIPADQADRLVDVVDVPPYKSDCVTAALYDTGDGHPRISRAVYVDGDDHPTDNDTIEFAIVLPDMGYFTLERHTTEGGDREYHVYGPDDLDDATDVRCEITGLLTLSIEADVPPHLTDDEIEKKTHTVDISPVTIPEIPSPTNALDLPLVSYEDLITPDEDEIIHLATI